MKSGSHRSSPRVVRLQNAAAWFVAALALLPCLEGRLHAETKPPANALEHWAFQRPAKVEPPDVRNQRWVKSDIDRFILARLEQAGVTPAPAAEARTLIRRMSFDLTGLPPTFAEVAAFERAMATDRDQAVQVLIERLLDSPQYGERWGRHWLDVARYSDTKGYVYDREERRFVHSPTYRDWVIRAFNEDLPYDRFLLLQIAGDQLLPEGSPDLAAMGFVTGGRRFIGVTHDIIDDRIDVVTRGAMALTVQCARCHDHKYDPIPTADYYSLYGVLHGADDRLIPLEDTADEDLVKARQKYDEMMLKRRAEAEERLRARAGEYLAAQLEMQKYPEEGFDQILGADDIIPASVRRWRDYLHQSVEITHPILGPWKALAKIPAADFKAIAPSALAAAVAGGKLNALVAAAFASPPESMAEAARRYGDLFAQAEKNADLPGAAEVRAFLRNPRSPATIPVTGIVNSDQYFPTPVGDELWKLQGAIERRMIELNARAALVLKDRPPGPNPRIFVRGSASRLGDEVPRQFVGLISGPDRKPFREGSGRLELARAIACADNPLTARVMVNRIWQHHLGLGLVKTPSDFGLRAESPSHPELLDWLAHRFIAEGWSVKAMHRLILSSAVYQQSSAEGESPFSQALEASDPDNRLLAHYPIRRLEFEAVRDAMLAVSGELDLTTGGKPMQLLEAANQRRTVYAYVDRQFLPGTFRTFDFANPDIHVAVRHETTVPQQALFFLNGSFAASRARTLVGRFAGLPAEERVQLLHQAVYQRRASRAEIMAALQFIEAAAAEQPPAPPEPPKTQWSYGTGEYDDATKQLKSFTPLAHYNGTAWQGAGDWPGGESGWAQLTATGGHPGNTRAHASVRRWTSPRAATVNIAGLLKHEPEQGDGIRAFVVSSRHGELKAATAHKSQVEMTAENVAVEAGDTIDFIVDIGDNLNSDQFLWEPVISASERRWEAKAEFTGPMPAPDYLEPWEQYAQVLLLANEFAFVD